MILTQCDCHDTRETLIVIVIEADNLARMEQADPITLEQGALGGFLKPVAYPEGLRLLIAYEKDAGEIYQMIQEGRDGEILRHLMRGYKFKPVDGDGVAMTGKQA